MRRSALVASALLVVLLAGGCKSGRTEGSKTQTSSAEAAGKAASPQPIPELKLGETPSWPAPSPTADEPVVARVAREGGKDTVYVFGAKDAEGISIEVRWRDASGTIIDSTSMTGGLLMPTDGWWRYTSAKRPKGDDATPPATAAEAQVTGLFLKGGKTWTPARMGWRYPSSGKPTYTDHAIGFEPVAIEREVGGVFGDQGRIIVHVTNLGSSPLERVDFQCDLVDASGKAAVTGIGGAWVPTIGERPHPELLPGQRAQVEVNRSLSPEALGLWAKKDLTAKCALQKR